jgi:hypothetical protein
VKPQYRHYNRDFIGDWSVPGDAVRWKIDVVRPGNYEVEVTYGCDPADAGGRYRLTAGSAKLEAVTEPGGRGSVYVRRTAGTFRLEKGPATLAMEAVSIPGKVLMEPHKLRLRRVPEPGEK